MTEPCWFLADPDAVLDYAVDWSSWLTGAETITSHTATGTDCTVDSSSEDSGVVTVWVSAPADGAQVTVHVVTSAGREDDRTLHLSVAER
jgi:hypothetical protein